MNNAGSKDTIAGVLSVIALAAAIVQVIYLPFAFGPLALVVLVIAILMSKKYHQLNRATAYIASVGFVAGGAIAVIANNPLY